MKLITAFLVVTPFMLSAAYADGDGERTSRIQRSIYEVAAGEYPAAGPIYDGRAATMSEPVEPMGPAERLGPGSPSDPEYFQHESITPNNNE
jgi:hypothetical protein